VLKSGFNPRAPDLKGREKSWRGEGRRCGYGNARIGGEVTQRA